MDNTTIINDTVGLSWTTELTDINNGRFNAIDIDSVGKYIVVGQAINATGKYKQSCRKIQQYIP